MIDGETLRAMQAPLKDRYRDEPGAAVVTLRATGSIGLDDVTCSVETSKAMIRAGLHPATGGDGLAACSGDMLLEALVACAGVTLNAVASALGVSLKDGAITAEGDLDFRGTLGIDRDTPVGFRAIRLGFTLDTDADDDTLDRLMKLTERYCVIFQTLTSPPAIEVSRTSTPAG